MITLLLAVVPLASKPIYVDFTKRTPISPYIYGANFPSAQLKTSFTLARQGGNRMSAYNWETNASNAGSDYRHQNDGHLGATDEPGWTARTFFQGAHGRGEVAILTVPAMGYVSADKNADGDVAQTDDYLNVRFHKSYAEKPGRKYVYPPDRMDKAVYQDEFIAWAEKTKAPGKKIWYSVDNEPDLWGHTHQRVWAKNPTYAQILKIGQEYAKMIKRVAPQSLVFGPANYGWQGFRTFQGAPDAKGRDFLDFYLSEMRKAEKTEGKRLLDALDIHWYPEAYGDGKRVALNDGNEGPGTHEARIQCPRSLWDPTYTEDSWIARTLNGRPIQLLPKVKEQIRRQYPGTKLAITEYDFGGGNHVSGLLAQADVLGAMGRYGVFAACHWGIGPERVATVAGFAAFRNMDGKGLRFGNEGLAVRGQSPPLNSFYASRDGRNLTAVAINKSAQVQEFEVWLKGFKPKTAEAFVRDASSLSLPKKMRARVVGSQLLFQMPPRSVASIRLVP